MNVELVTKQIALKKHAELKALAFSIAAANDTLPAYCAAPECRLYCDYAALASELKEGEVCIFVDNHPARLVTNFATEHGTVVGRLCGLNVMASTIEENYLTVHYMDGVKERYVYLPDINAYQFVDKNISLNLPSTSAN